MKIDNSELKDLGFKLTHECIRDGEAIKLNPALSAHQLTLNGVHPMVYLWLSPEGDKFEVLYVGKAGLGVKQRMRQHEGGFRHSSTGKKNQDLLLGYLKQGRQVVVYARKSEEARHFDVAVNLYSVEEEALCEKFQPLWNRAQFAGGAKRSESTGGVRVIVGPPAIVEEAASPWSGQLVDGIDLTGILRGSMVAEFYEGLDQPDKDRFHQVLDWALALDRAQDAQLKVVLGYARQPQGYSGLPTLLIAELGVKSKAKKDRWVARIPLRCDEQAPLTVTLPEETMAPGLDPTKISSGEGNFRPLDLEDFLRDPAKYTTQT